MASGNRIQGRRRAGSMAAPSPIIAVKPWGRRRGREPLAAYAVSPLIGE